jgi:arginase
MIYYMNREINFLGLEFEGGQQMPGLVSSHQYARQYFSFLKSLGLKINDCGSVSSNNVRQKLFSFQDFLKFNWQDYEWACLEIERLLQQPATLLNWGGDHSVGISTAGAFLNAHPDGYIVWIDAHADLNLPDESPTGNFHGMPLSILMNLENIKANNLNWLQEKLRPQNLIYVGVRELDPFERKTIQELDIKLYSVHDIRNKSMRLVAEEILQITENRPLHISFDIDSVCPEIAPSTGVPVPNGLTAEDIQTLAIMLAKHPDLRSVDIVEINPAVGSRLEVERTYQMALSFLILIFSLGGSYANSDRPAYPQNTASLEQSS